MSTRRTTTAAQITPLTWLIAAGAAVLFLVIILAAALNQDVLKTKDLQPLLVSAPEGPIKTRPQEPTGKQFPHQDKAVYNLLASSSPVESAPEPQSMPEALPSAIEAALAENEKEEKAAEATKAEVVEEKPVPAPVIAKIEPAPAPKPEPTPAPAPTPTASGGTHLVQLAAFTSRAEADSAAAKYAGKYGVLAKLSADIQKADVKGTTYYRVRFAGGLDATSAGKVCSNLKAAGQGCLVVKK